MIWVGKKYVKLGVLPSFHLKPTHQNQKDKNRNF